MITITDYPNRDEWLRARGNSIGASEIGIVLGESKYKTPYELYREKIGEAPAVIVSSDRLTYGTKAEQYIRELFKLQYEKKFTLQYNQFGIWKNSKYPYLHCTLDGYLTDIETNEKGIWECKTCWIKKKEDYDSWKNSIPQTYYLQLLQQLAVTEADFAWLTAQLILPDGGSDIRHYKIRRDKVQEDIDYVVTEAEKFYKCIKYKTPPKQKLSL